MSSFLLNKLMTVWQGKLQWVYDGTSWVYTDKEIDNKVAAPEPKVEVLNFIYPT